MLNDFRGNHVPEILIANRGEIACRVIKTARKMGIKTVAVYSEADKDARHVELADEAVCIGPPPSRESYLAMDKIIAACKQTGAEAVHPGYGSSPRTRSSPGGWSRRGSSSSGPSITPWPPWATRSPPRSSPATPASTPSPATTTRSRRPTRPSRSPATIGYPVMIKASAGGGGKGLRVARNDKEADEGFSSCRTEARNAFGDDRVFIEKFVEEPRHIEIQVLGDAHGNVVHLWERECSIQRRHQKVIEEAPSPFLDDATRRAMGEQAVALARAVKYQSAGTVEFVVGKDKSFYFLEMNTRLQVEHPVTEMITGLDLVELMIRVAAGEPLPFTQDQIRREGWAIECRINAEDPFRGFLPSTGRLVRFLPPDQDPGAVRVDTGVYEGDEISIYYDSMIAKLITHGATRGQAIARMRDALNALRHSRHLVEHRLPGGAVQHPRFVAGDFHTGFIAEEFPKGFHPSTLPHEDPLLLAAVAAYARRRYIHRAVRITGQLKGHERRVGRLGRADAGPEVPPDPHLVDGGCDVTYEGKTHALRTDWKLGDILLRGTWDGETGLPSGRADGPEIPRLPLGHAGRRHRDDRPGRRAAGPDARQAPAGPLEVPALAHARPADRDGRQAGPGGACRREPRGHRGHEDAEHPQGRKRLRGRRSAGQAGR